MGLIAGFIMGHGGCCSSVLFHAVPAPLSPPLLAPQVRAQGVDIELPMCLFCTVVPPVKTAGVRGGSRWRLLGVIFLVVGAGCGRGQVSGGPGCTFSTHSTFLHTFHLSPHCLAHMLHIRPLTHPKEVPLCTLPLYHSSVTAPPLRPPPLTHTAFKITVVTNRTPPQLTALFEDLLSLAGAGMSQALAAGSAGGGGGGTGEPGESRCSDVSCLMRTVRCSHFTSSHFPPRRQ